MANRSASAVREPDVYRHVSPVEQVAAPNTEQVTFTVATPTPAPAAPQREQVPAAPVPVHVMPVALAVGNVSTILGATALAAFGVAGIVTGGALAVGAAGAVAAARSSRGRKALAKTWGRAKSSPLGAALGGRGRSGSASKRGGLLGGGRPGMRAKAGKGLFGLGSKPSGKSFGKGGRSLAGPNRAGSAKGKGKGFLTGKGLTRAGSAKGRAGLGRSGKSPLASLGAKTHGARKGKAGLGSLLGVPKSRPGHGAKSGGRGTRKGSGGGGWTKLAGGLGSRLGSLAKAGKAAGSASTRLGRVAKAARMGATAGAVGGWRSLSKAAKATGKHAAAWWEGASKTSRPPLMAQEERVADVVQRPDEHQIAPAALQAPDPISKTSYNPGGTVQPGVFTGGSSMSFRLAEVSGEFHSAAVSYQPENMVQFQRDLNRVPELLGNIAQGIKVFAANADGQTPTGKAVIAQLQGIYELLLNASNAAAELNPAFRRAHETDLHRLTNPRTNERMWDVTANSH